MVASATGSQSTVQTDPPLPPFPDVASRIQQSNDVVFEQATRITDKDTLRFEAALGDDVAGVRTTSNALEHNEDYATSDPTKALHEEQETPTSYSVVCDRVPCSNRDRGVSDNALQTVQVLEDAAAALDIDVEPNVKKWFDLDLDDPEMQEKKTYSRMTKEEHRHLLLQYTTIPALCRELIFDLFDQKQRHAIIRQMWTKVHANPKAFERYGELMASHDSAMKLQNAIEHTQRARRQEQELSLRSYQSYPWEELKPLLVPWNRVTQLLTPLHCHRDTDLQVCFSMCHPTISAIPRASDLPFAVSTTKTFLLWLPLSSLMP